MSEDSIKLNFDVKQVGDTLYTSVVRYEGEIEYPTYSDIDVEDMSLKQYKEDMGYTRELNNYDYMLIGFSHLLNYMQDNKVYEEGDIVIEYKNDLLFKWVEEGLSKTSKKYLPHFNHIMRHMKEILDELEDTELELIKSVKNNAKHFLTKTHLKDMGYDMNVKTGVKLGKNSQLGYKKKTDNTVRRNNIKRASKESLGKKIIDINSVSKFGS